MEITRQVATWLELAVAPEWRRNTCRIRVHPVGGREDHCFAISMNDRWLCSGSGGLTVFCGRDTAARFLKLMRIDDFEAGEPPVEPVSCDASRYCLCIDRNSGLKRCTASKAARQYHS
jgi:hypothetical protein